MNRLTFDVSTPEADPNRACPKCGQAWAVHHGDGSCVEDKVPPQHSELCVQSDVDNFIARELWIKLYPNYCRTCQSLGYVKRETPLPIPGNWFRANCTECPACTGKNRCSRCGTMLILQADRRPNEEVPCLECDWHHGKIAGDTLPAEHQCSCHVGANRQHIGVGQPPRGWGQDDWEGPVPTP